MKLYLLSIQQPDGPPPPPEVLATIVENVEAMRDELRASGAWVFSEGLHDPSTATVVRVRGEETLITDGPYAEGKEHVGGLIILRAPHLDAALEWARKAARATTLPIEVRPFRTEE